ncbi:uncharacterized protein B0H18DRAFT_1007427 [Fomitopsis serialis]|uniref:uncharacterized protein n=1 Tax=Fomitopsis serialis TaxID=139415 RepID=UPI002008546F|nr:uncharacterized protein B0H18DRAFT_1007427 [Neoantrodia serialis]KAH9926007.1 hypothetical protein B0H18DRAFT_1007427 [Neoantrodia serialis]
MTSSELPPPVTLRPPAGASASSTELASRSTVASSGTASKVIPFRQDSRHEYMEEESSRGDGKAATRCMRGS